jgi:MFS family permease
MKNKYLKGIGINILLLGSVSFLNDMSSEMILPILPMFIAALGGTGLIIGLIGGLRDSISSILKVFCGYWSDRIGKRKIFVSTGYSTSIFFKFLLGLSTLWQHVLVFASMERIGKGIRTAPRDAIIADSMPKERGKGFGIHRSLDTLGAIMGSVIVFLLFWFLELKFTSIILIAAMIGFLALIPLYYVHEIERKPKKITLKIGLKTLPRELRLFIFISAVFALANFSYMFFILQAQASFEGKLAIGIPILLFIFLNIFYSGFAIPFGSLSDKIGRKKIIIVGYLLFGITTFGFAIFNSLTAFLFFFALYGIVFAMIDGNQRAYVSDLSPPDFQATALGTYHTTIGLIALPASLAAGLIWQFTAPSFTFIYGSLISFAAVILFLILWKNLE